MNQQLEQLALRAGFNLHNDIIDGHNFSHEIEVFAQLIVAHCAEVALSTNVSYTEIDAMHKIRDRILTIFCD